MIKGTDLILHVTPSKFVRNTIKQYAKFVTNQPIIMCSKGFEKETLKTLDEVIKEEMPEAKVGALSGPSHAEEVSVAIPTVLVVASNHDDILQKVQETFMCSEMRIYTSKDVKGVELRWRLKKYYRFLCRSSSRN